MSPSKTKNVLDEGLPELSLRDILLPIFRHKRLVIGVFCGVMLLSALVAWGWAARYYVSSMQIVVDQSRSDPAVTPGENAAVQTNRPVTADQIASEMVLLQGPDMMRKVAATCGLAEKKHWSLSNLFLPEDPVQRRAAETEAAAAALGKSISVDEDKSSDVIDVKYGSLGNPETPACVLQNLSQLYLQKHLELKRPAGSTEFFANETEKYKEQLANDEEQLTALGRTAGVAAPDVLRTNMAQQVANSEGALYDARQAIVADQRRISDEQTQMAKMSPRTITQQSTNAADTLMQTLQSTLLADQVKRTELLTKFQPTYPLVVEVNQEIKETQAAIAKAQDMKYVNETTDRDPTYEFLQEDLAKTQADLASQRGTANALVNSINSMKMQMVDLNGKAVQQDALERTEKADAANYLLYLNKREEERSSDVLDKMRIADVAIAVPPIVPLIPAHSPVLVMMIGFVLATMMSIGAGVMAEYLDPSFRTPAEVAESLGMPVLASVPRQVA
ncbi:MAG TPA: hypothetical protein VMD77_11985 [Candidatus Baltobacteraceae bacterium]|nr:hypothetical protein [Candidatus Baltobacteraceae bacterium]